MSSLFGGLLRALGGQSAEDEVDSVHSNAANRRETAAAAAAAAAAAPAESSQAQGGPSARGHRQRQRLLAEAASQPLPPMPGHGQQEVEQALPASLTVTVCDKQGNPVAATFGLQHVEGLLPLLSGQDLFKQDLGPGGDITAANFYAACATSLTAAAPHARSIGFGFVVEGPATHHLLRLELLAARAGLPLEDGAFNDIIHNKADSMLTEGAAKLFAHLWRHDRGSRKQMELCEDLVQGFAGRSGASPAALDNLLRRVYKDAYNDTPSKAPKISLRLPIAAQQQQPAAPAQHLQDDEGLQQLEGLDQQPDWLPQQEAGLAVVPFALPGDNIDMIAAMRAELQALKQQVLDLERRLILVEFGI